MGRIKIVEGLMGKHEGDYLEDLGLNGRKCFIKK